MSPNMDSRVLLSMASTLVPHSHLILLQLVRAGPATVVYALDDVRTVCTLAISPMADYACGRSLRWSIENCIQKDAWPFESKENPVWFTLGP